MLRFFGRSVCWSVTFYFSYDLYSLTPLLLPKWSGDLKEEEEEEEKEGEEEEEEKKKTLYSFNKPLER